MVRLTVVTLSSLLALSALPIHAQTPGDVLQGVGRAMNGEPNRPPDWRDHERDLDARRRALHDQRRYEEGNGYYGNGFYGPSR
jgi:hypothetical protein